MQPGRNADGIVVLTGGSSRVSDAIELLAAGYGKRLLISGVHPTNGVQDISRPLPDSHRWLACCVDLDRSAINTRSNAAEARRWAREHGFRSLIVVTSNYHMPRAMVELSHAMPDVDLIPFAVVGDKWRTSRGGPVAHFRLLLSEYAKYLAAEMRVRLASLGLDLATDADNAFRAGRSRQTRDGSRQLIGSSMMSIFLRSLVFNVLFYLLLAFCVLVGIPTYLLPRPAVMNIAEWWGQSSIWLVRVICGIKVEFRGLEKIPRGPLIVAAKHQSMWETFALMLFFDAPLYILKRELTWIPLFGWYLRRRR